MRRGLIKRQANGSAQNKPLATEPKQKLWRIVMTEVLRKMWSDDQGQDIAEYALMAAVILVVVAATVTAIGTRAGSIFTSVNLALQNN